MFIQQDPKSQDYYSISPYAYCAGNPVSNIDIDGCKLDPTSKSLQKQLQIIMCQTKTGRKQYEKLITNESIIKVVILKDYMSEKQIAGENSLQRLRRIPSTREIIGGICEITISLAAVADFAKAEGLTVTERLAATLAEEVQHTELENILLQLEERQEEQSTGRKIDYKDKKSEQQAHIYRDKVIEEYKQYKK